METVTVLALIAVLSAASYTVLYAMKLRGSFSAVAASLNAAMHKVRADAYGSGVQTVFVVNQSSGQYWGIEDVAGTFNLLTFDPTNPAPTPAKLLLSGTLPSTVTFGPSTGYPGTTLPQPFNAVHAGGSCTFCLAIAPNAGYGALAFQPVGGVLFSGGISTDGSFTIQSPNGQTPRSYTTFAIVGRTGLVQPFSGTF